MQRISANFAVGLNCPVSMELIVFLDTPTISASFACAIASKAETYEMKYSDGKYTLTLTDSNSILSEFNYKTTGGISVSQSGNKLTLTSTSPERKFVRDQIRRLQAEGRQRTKSFDRDSR